MEDEHGDEQKDVPEAPLFEGIARCLGDAATKVVAKSLDGARRLTMIKMAYQRHLRRLTMLNTYLFVLAMLFSSVSAALHTFVKKGVLRSFFAILGTLAQGMSFGLLLAMFILLISLKSSDSELD